MSESTVGLQPGMDAPFPWAGSKRRVAAAVWDAFGDVHHYVEPFAGSLAVLLRRPVAYARRVETVSDLDGYVSNFWRAVRAAPDAVAAWADYPVSHVDLHARHVALDRGRDGLLARLAEDPEWYDARLAGWWVWGLSAWIGTEWCEPGKATGGMSDAGVTSKRPHLANAGKGIHAPRTGEDHEAMIRAWMRSLSARLRHVRLMHGDWSRCVSSGVMSAAGPSGVTGVLLDPPYDPAVLADTGRMLYAGGHDRQVSAEAREWALGAASDRVRVALCGYEEEHGPHMPGDWRAYAWASQGLQVTASSRSGESRGQERVWFSPACLGGRQPSLFDVMP